jgi:hypothetical protein
MHRGFVRINKRAIFDGGAYKCGPFAWAVYCALLALADHRDGAAGVVKVSKRHLAEVCGLNRKTVDAAIFALSSCGEITETTNRNGTDFEIMDKSFWGEVARQMGHEQETGGPPEGPEVARQRGHGGPSEGPRSVQEEKNKKNFLTRSATPPQKTKGSFSPPSLEEAETHAEAAGLEIDVSAWFDYCERSEWRTSEGRRITNWKSHIGRWKDREEPIMQKHGSSNGSTQKKPTGAMWGSI